MGVKDIQLQDRYDLGPNIIWSSTTFYFPYIRTSPSLHIPTQCIASTRQMHSIMGRALLSTAHANAVVVLCSQCLRHTMSGCHASTMDS